MKILLIDDDEWIRDSLKIFFEAQGCDLLALISTIRHRPNEVVSRSGAGRKSLWRAERISGMLPYRLFKVGSYIRICGDKSGSFCCRFSRQQTIKNVSGPVNF